MIKDLPLSFSLLFVAVVIITIVWFYFLTKSKTFLLLAIGWTLLQSLFGWKGVYQNTEAMPPRIMLLGMLPALLLIVCTFLTNKGRSFIDQIDLKRLTYFHSIRIPVEVVLSLLFHYGVMSVYITFEGTNFDILSGITAPIVASLAYSTGKRNAKLLLGWNIIALLLLLNVVVTAIFAIPSPFQKLAFEQPNIAVLYFPFNLLPTSVVPLVLFGHLVAFRKLMKERIVN